MAISDPLQSPAHMASATALVRRVVTEFGGRHWRRYALALGLSAIAAACTALSAYLVGEVVNAAYVNRDMTLIYGIGIATVVLFTVKGIATYGQAVVLARIGNAIISENQRRIFAKLLQENLAFYADRHSSEFVARLSAGANSARQVLQLFVNAIGRDGLSLIALVGVMVYQDPVMSLIGLVVLPPAMLVLRSLVRRVRRIAMVQFTGGTRILETMQEALQGIRIVKAFGLEEPLRQRFDANVADVQREANKLARVSNRASPLMETLGGIAIALALVYGGYRVVATGSTPGQFVSFIAAFLLAYEPAKRLARFNLDLNAALVGVRVLFDILDKPASEPPDDHMAALKLAHANARIEFADVRFSYRPGEPVLRGISFVAQPRQVTALVGASGGGKSTILNLILRFYEIDGGAILIDGQNIGQVSRHSLRSHIGYVGQDVFLFHGSVRDNIAFGKPGATEADIVAASQAANAHDFILAFPQGYDTPVGEHGLQLSGGQRQRISIARALIKDAPIVLLDEATAALDSESEREVQRALEHLCEDRTTLVIAHRLPTVAHADRILVIEDGVVAESGRHDELLRQGGRYASFYRLQLQGQDQPDDLDPLKLKQIKV